MFFLPEVAKSCWVVISFAICCAEYLTHFINNHYQMQYLQLFHPLYGFAQRLKHPWSTKWLNIVGSNWICDRADKNKIRKVDVSNKTESNNKNLKRCAPFSCMIIVMPSGWKVQLLQWVIYDADVVIQKQRGSIKMPSSAALTTSTIMYYN